MKRKIALLSNITVDLIANKLSAEYDVYFPEGYDTWIQEVLNTSFGLYSHNPDAIIILLDGTESISWKELEEAKERLDTWKQAVLALAENVSDIPIFITTIDIRENRIKSFAERKYRLELENDWYQFAQEEADKKNNLYVLDLLDTITDIGRDNFYSDKMWYMSNMPYSRDGLNVVVSEINRALNSAFVQRKKIISLDLDNTLWGGVVGEDGMEGIELSDHKEGQRFYDFQRQLLEMKRRGILLAVNSKNNYDDAESVISTHSAMLLRESDFVSQKINWENKADNLKEMESELNLTEGGFIFIDDNPIEQETVRGECPEMTVPIFPKDTSKLRTFAEDIWFDYCRPLRVLGEDLQKTEMYQSEVKRKKEMSGSLNLDDYIARLEIMTDIHRIRSDEFVRAAQLCSKTNQFNVTTKRYTLNELEEIASNPNNEIYVIYASDKYGDSGLISVLILVGDDKTVRIDTFLMSCRVMGRRLEDVIINEIVSHSEKSKIIGEYIPTTKNSPVRELYDKLGFKCISDTDGHRQYELSVSDYRKKQFDYYKEIKFEE